MQTTRRDTKREKAEQAALDQIARNVLERLERGDLTFGDIAALLGLKVHRLQQLKTTESWSTKTLIRLAVASGQEVVGMISKGGAT